MPLASLGGGVAIGVGGRMPAFRRSRCGRWRVGAVVGVGGWMPAFRRSLCGRWCVGAVVGVSGWMPLACRCGRRSQWVDASVSSESVWTLACRCGHRSRWVVDAGVSVRSSESVGGCRRFVGVGVGAGVSVWSSGSVGGCWRFVGIGVDAGVSVRSSESVGGCQRFVGVGVAAGVSVRSSESVGGCQRFVGVAVDAGVSVRSSESWVDTGVSSESVWTLACRCGRRSRWVDAGVSSESVWTLACRCGRWRREGGSVGVGVVGDVCDGVGVGDGYVSPVFGNKTWFVGECQSLWAMASVTLATASWAMASVTASSEVESVTSATVSSEMALGTYEHQNEHHLQPIRDPSSSGLPGWSMPVPCLPCIHSLVGVLVCDRVESADPPVERVETFRSVPKPTKISNDPKVKRKRYQGKQKCKNGSVSPGLGKVYWTLRGLLFYQCFQLGRFGFSLRSKAEEVGKKISKNCQNVSQIHQK